MKIVLAPDKFKSSLTGVQFCNAVEESLKKIIPNAKIVKLPLADGGDGTIEVVAFYLKGKEIQVTVSNPFFQPIKATYLYSEKTKTAFIEMAEASGVKLIQPEQLDCKNATTLGAGQMIVDSIEKGAENIILGIGGSATNDCGIGMATALGYQFLDSKDEVVKPIGANLSKIKSINASKINSKLKGTSMNDIRILDKGLTDFAEVLQNTFQVNVQSVKGAGAAGGMGIASKVFLNAQLKPGIELIKSLANFDNKILGADWIITGEGKLDNQTLSGKTIQGVLTSAKGKNIKVAAFCGALDLDAVEIKDFGIHYADAVIKYAENLEDAMENSEKYVKKIAEKFAETLLLLQ